MKESLGEAYHQFHLRHGRYGFAHHLTSKGNFYRREIGEGRNVLDLGCRDGVMSEAFAKGNRLTCLDIDREGLNRCMERLHVETMWHDMNDPLPFGNASFDAVVLSDVLEHVILHQQLVSECRRVLRGGGIFLGSTPNAYNWKNRIRMMLGIDIIEYIDPMHVRHFSLDSLACLIGGNFSEFEVIPYGRHCLTKALPGLFAADFLWKAVREDGP